MTFLLVLNQAFRHGTGAVAVKVVILTPCQRSAHPPCPQPFHWTTGLTISSDRAFTIILPIFLFMVREITALHFFPSFLPLFPASSGIGTPESSSGICDDKGGSPGTLLILGPGSGGKTRPSGPGRGWGGVEIRGPSPLPS